MEKQRDKVKEVSKDLKEKTDKELERLRAELNRLKKLKELREKRKQAEGITDEVETIEEEQIEEEIEASGVEEIESKLNEMDQFLTKELERTDHKTYEENAIYIEEKLQELEQEIVGETGLIEEELTPFEKLVEVYPWLNEPRYEYMFQIPNRTENPSDYESWKNEWGKVLFDYAKYAILHILYLRQLYTEKPFSKFNNRKEAIKEIADYLVDQELAKWISKKKEKLRVYWKTIDLWAEEIYEWAYEIGKLEPILVYEIRNSEQQFSTLPLEDIEKIFKMLTEAGKAKLIKLDDGKLALKILLE